MISLAPLIEKRGWLIAGGFALAATVLTVILLSQERQRLASEAYKRMASIQENSADVVFAATDIPAGKVISEDMLYTKLIARNTLPSEAVTSIARAVGRIATSPIKKDSYIAVDRLAWPTTRDTSLAMKTPIGKRAMTISADNISSLVGMIKPGDYVDVIGLIPLPDMIEGKPVSQPSTVPLFQNVLILAVGSQLASAIEKDSGSRRKQPESQPSSSKDSAPLITLSLSPEEANILAFIQAQGKIQLVLRSAGDAETRAVSPVTWATVLKYLFPDIELRAKEEEKVEEAPQAPQVEIIRGFKREMIPLTQGK